jgi:predicted transcriptional regulator
VVDKDQRLIGLISRSDIVKAMGRKLCESGQTGTKVS